MNIPRLLSVSSPDHPVLITGHTGFKGTWMTLLLEQLGISSIGYSLAPTENSLFKRLERKGKIPETFSDIRNSIEVDEFICKYKPSSIIHLAAQPIVSESYTDPYSTFETNLMGTLNLLQSAFKYDFLKAIMVITTDKVYKNDELRNFFKESDCLEGKDPYSSSKVAVEAAVKAWQSLENKFGGPKVFSVRAGNVIGGGDFAKDRLFPDLIRSLLQDKPIKVRNPNSTRPWQHVLDPTIGYLMALEHSLNGNAIESFNFGPDGESLKVKEVLEIAQSFRASESKIDYLAENKIGLESEFLQLDSSLAREVLGWRPYWSQVRAVESTMTWWDKVLNKKISPENACRSDILEVLN